MTTIYHGNSAIEPFDLSVTLPIQSADNTGITLVSSVIIPDDVNILDIDCFYNCSSLSSISIPSSVTSLGENCFYNCSSLSSISIPSSVTSLGENCFGSCTSLSSVNIPLAIITLPGSCFSYCSSLVSIDIPSSVVSIGQNCFSNCSSLNSVIIPSLVTSLGERCFNICNSLKAVYFKGSPLSIASRSFYGDTFTALTPSPASSELLLHLSAKGLTTSGISSANGVKDISGRGNHGTQSGGVSVATDSDLGDCFSFDGTDDYMSFSNFATAFGGLSGVTIAFTVKLNTLKTYNTIYAADYSGTAAFACRIHSNGTVYFGGKRTSSETSTTYKSYSAGIKVNTVYNMAVIYDYAKAKIRLFINGELKSEQDYLTAGTFLTESLSTAFLWGRQGSDRLNGIISDARIYGRALSATEVAQLYKSVQWTPKIKSSTYGGASSVTWATLPTSPILALDALTSTTGTGGAKDISGNGYHGSLTGTAGINVGENAFTFDGTTTSKLEVTNSSFLSAINGKSGYSISMSAKCDLTANRHRAGGLVTSGSSLSGFFYFFTDHINFYDRMSSGSDDLKSLVSDANSITSGVYHTATATVDYSTGTAILYIDGVEVKRSTNWHSGGTKNITTGVKLGGNSTAAEANFNGSIRNFRVYDRVLTPAEVAALHDNTKADISPLVLAYKINQVDTATARYVIDYAEDATNYTPITYSGTTPNMGSWESWINAHFTPVMLKSNGTVDYELNRNNLNYKADGTTVSDISNTSYDGNAMLRIKKFYISCSSETVGSGSDAYTVHTIKMCDSKIDNTYTCWGFVDADGKEKDYVYYALYNCHKDSNNKLRSISGVTLNDSRPGNQLLSYNDMVAAAKANGTGWDISNLALENAIGLVMMMIYKSVNPTFINQEYVDLYKQSMSVYQVTGTRNADGGFPHVTASQKQKALWIESFWRNYDNINQSRPWINGLASLRTGTGSNDFMPYYRKQPPYDDFTTISNWTPMSSTTPHAYMSDAVSHELKTVMFYDNIMFPKDDGVARQGSITEATINRYFGGGEISGSTSTSLQYTDRLLPAQTCGGVMQDQYSSMPHYLGYSLVGTGINNYQKYGSGRLIYMPS